MKKTLSIITIAACTWGYFHAHNQETPVTAPAVVEATPTPAKRGIIVVAAPSGDLEHRFSDKQTTLTQGRTW